MKMNYTEVVGVTINAGLLAILYTIFGAFISYVMYHIFDEFNDTWTKRSELYKFTDVTVESPSPKIHLYKLPPNELLLKLTAVLGSVG
jgi:hypothetical protein